MIYEHKGYGFDPKTNEPSVTIETDVETLKQTVWMRVSLTELGLYDKDVNI